MKKIKVLIVEDNASVQRVLANVLNVHFPEIELIGSTGYVAVAVNLINSQSPDLILMDIHLNDGTAFDILNQVNSSLLKIIFISAYHEYMLESLKFSSVDFIFKPFDINDVILSVDKTLNDIVDNDSSSQLLIDAFINNTESNGQNKKLTLIGRNTLKIIPYSDIVWGKSNMSSSEFHFSNKSEFTTIEPLRKYELLLAPKGFVRCHSHFLMNILHVSYVDPINEIVEFRNGDQVPFDTRKYDSIMELIHVENVLK